MEVFACSFCGNDFAAENLRKYCSPKCRGKARQIYRCEVKIENEFHEVEVDPPAGGWSRYYRSLEALPGLNATIRIHVNENGELSHTLF